MSDEREKAIIEARVRDRQWMYWGPVAVAPIPYICVSLYRNAKTPQAKQLLLGVGMVGIPIATYFTRVYLLQNSTSSGVENRRALSLEERHKIESRL
jgi:hypothetical protein